MESEWYVTSDGEEERSTNNNPNPKQWSTSSIPGLVSLEESIVLDHRVMVATSQPGGKPEEKRGRRKSWHIKMERKRRKGVINDPAAVPSSSPPPLGGFSERQKRPSWWNIFAPDNWPRSRRASQDISRSTENFVPWQRSKSRSVDHGFSPPFDLDSLRSKVEGRFESVDKLSRDSDGGGSKSELSEKKMGKSLPPVNTITYTVEPADTLTSVAARFDTTPSELTKLNRLTTRLVFPGQVLYVPDKKGRGGGGGSEDGGESADDEDTTPVALHPNGGGPAAFEERDFLDNLRPVSPKPLPGHIERVKTPSSPRTSATSSIDGDSEQQQLQRKVLERFLKINVRHITDGQGVVGGVLLVTPNAVMFDPNVSDPLVIEHGPESYGVIAPMEFVVNAAIYSDIAHMRVGHSSEIPKSDAPKPEIYHSKDSSNMFKSTDTLMDSMSTTCTFTANAQNSPGKDSLLVKDETFPELAPVRSSPEDNEIEDNESVCSCTGRDIIRDGDAFPKAFERDLVTPTNLVSSDNETVISDRKDNRQLSFESSSFANQKIEADAISKSESDKSDDPGELFRCVEERRKSCLDHHWPMSSIDRSVDKESEDILTVVKSEKVVELVKVSEDDDEVNLLVKQSCHDSGIDIHEVGVTDLVAQASASTNSNEPDLTNLHPITKKVYSDADIILGSEFVPPLTSGLMSMSQDSAIIEGSRKKTSSVSFSLDSNQETEGTGMDKDSGEEGEKHETRKNKMLKRLSYPLAWMEGLTGDNKDEKEGLPALPTIDGQQHSSVFSKVFSSSPINLVDFSTGLFLAKTPSEESSKSPGPGPPPPTPAALAAGPDSDSFSSMVVDTAGAMLSGVGRSSVGTFIRQHPHPSEPKTHVPKAPPPKLDYRSMVSVDDMPELFVSFDKLIPRPARSCDDPPLYLRLRMGKPINKKIPKSTPIMSYGKKKMRPEYWFSVPRNRVDELYSFLQLWVPHLYGDLDDMDPKSRGFELVESDTELWEDEGGDLSRRGTLERSSSSEDGDLGELTRESWEVSVNDDVEAVEVCGALKNVVACAAGFVDGLELGSNAKAAVVRLGFLEMVRFVDSFYPGSRLGTFFQSCGVADLMTTCYGGLRDSRVAAAFAKSGKTLTELEEEMMGGKKLQVLSMSEELRRALYASSVGSLDLDLLIPELVGVTEILTEEHRKKLCRHLPARAEGYLWTLVFSTSQHGFSLNSLYRKMNRLESPILMVIEDTEHNVFGALTSCAMKVSDHFYGTGESLLFRFTPEFQVFPWTGENMYFIKGNNESLAIGTGDGKFGLWLDGDLYQGTTQPCSTYGNEPLSPQEDFVVKTLECWAFI